MARAGEETLAPKETVGGRRAGTGEGIVSALAPPADASVLANPQKAFGYFRERHTGKAALEENKALLGEKYGRAKVCLCSGFGRAVLGRGRT